MSEKTEEKTNHRTNNTGPRYRKHGGRICYHKKDLKLWSGLNDCGSKIDHAQHV